MVQIFKAMKGAWNFEIAKFASKRLHKNIKVRDFLNQVKILIFRIRPHPYRCINRPFLH